MNETEKLEAALVLMHEIKAQLRTHVGFEHASALMAAVGDMSQAARAHLNLLKAIDEKRLAVVPCEPNGTMNNAGIDGLDDICCRDSQKVQ